MTDDSNTRPKTIYYIFESTDDEMQVWEYRGQQRAYNADQARREFISYDSGCFVAVAQSGWQPQLASTKITWTPVGMPDPDDASDAEPIEIDDRVLHEALVG